MPQVEILSPAGSMESFRAAVNAGADAIYVGGSMFGARAYANNFDERQLIEALDFAHIHGKKVYLTVNTLLKNAEMENTLYNFLLPAYENGLDAVIVQDFGVFDFIRKNFWNLDIHASTQMTTNSVLSAKLLEKKGATRIVTSRELSLEEIKAIRRETTIEIESFVHGALCYCYSGQCLLSSMIGGRSGNRGRCAQPCRLSYSAYKEDGKSLLEKEKHILSPKDICTLEILPDIIDAGVYSLKIEGRMKSPQYTAGVVSVYRKYVDLYMALGRVSYKVDEEDVRNLMDLFNRGNFSKGYYVQKNGPEMMSMDRPNHRGTKAIEVVSSAKGKMTVRALNDLNPQDVVDVSPEFTWTNGQKRKMGEIFCVNIPGNLKVKNGAIYYRVRNNALLKEIDERYLEQNIREDVVIKGEFFLGKKAWASISCGDYYYETHGNVVEAALNSPMDVTQIEKQLKKLGNTEFCAEAVRVEADDNIFISVQELKELRRKLTEGLTKEMIVRRDAPKRDGIGKEIVQNSRINAAKTIEHDWDFRIKINVTIYDKSQLPAVLSEPNVKRVYFDMSKDGFKSLVEVAEIIKNAGKEAFLVLPYIFRKDTCDKFIRNLALIKAAEFDGFLVKNLDELQFLTETDMEGLRILDYNMYQMNNRAKEFFDGISVDGYTVAVELNQNEILAMDNSGSEMIVYGRIPAMVSAQCVMKNLAGCKKNTNQAGSVLYLKDRVGKDMPVLNQCDWCYNVIYNAQPINLLDQAEAVAKCKISNVRLDFFLLTKEEIQKVLKQAVESFIQKKEIEVKGDFTRGHFLRGVE